MRVAVLAGGLSRQRDASLATGTACAAALTQLGCAVLVIDPAADLLGALAQFAPDRAFNALRGGPGEGGVVQGVLEHLRLPYTHSGVLASSLANDKHQAKLAFKSAGVTVTDHVVAARADAARQHVMTPPYVLKPIRGEGGEGIAIVMSHDDPPPPMLASPDWGFGEDVMIERFVPGRDLACVVIGDVAIGVIDQPRSSRRSLRKGVHSQTEHQALSPKIYDKAQKMALAAHAALGCRGITKVDFRFHDRAGEEGELVCLEINTQPDLAPGSGVAELAERAGQPFAELVRWIVEDASCNR